MIVAGLALAATSGIAAAANPAPASATGASRGKPAGKGGCSLQDKDRSGCSIKFVMNPPQIVFNSDYMTIDGAHIPTEVKLYLLKNALHRPWTYEKDKRSLVVCRRGTAVGYLTQVQIYCETNGQHMRAKHGKDVELDAAGAIDCGAAPEFTAGTVKVPPRLTRCLMAETLRWAEVRNLSTVLAGMSKLPPAGGSRTLRIKRDGQLASKWIFQDGRLVGVWNHVPLKDRSAHQHPGPGQPQD